MLSEIKIKELLEKSLKEYIRRLEMSDLHYAKNGAEAIAYMKVLEWDEKIYKYLDIDKAKKILEQLK